MRYVLEHGHAGSVADLHSLCAELNNGKLLISEQTHQHRRPGRRDFTINRRPLGVKIMVQL